MFYIFALVKQLNIKVMYFRINDFFVCCTDEERFEVLSCFELSDNLQVLMSSLDLLRSRFGHPIFITSGYRNIEHNKRVGGVSNSWHTKMCAVDIKPKDPNLFQHLVDVVDDNHNLFPEVVIYKGYIHLSIKD